MSAQGVGILEETVLLIVLAMKDEAYGVSVAEEYMSRTGRSISIPAIHTVLKRLEIKGYLSSSFGGATTDRGGRKKRLFEVTKFGYKTLEELRQTREELWQLAPKYSI